jgi:hypothetical protein
LVRSFGQGGEDSQSRLHRSAFNVPASLEGFTLRLGDPLNRVANQGKDFMDDLAKGWNVRVWPLFRIGPMTCHPDMEDERRFRRMGRLRVFMEFRFLGSHFFPLKKLGGVVPKLGRKKGEA